MRGPMTAIADQIQAHLEREEARSYKAELEIERLRTALRELKGHVNKQEPLGIIDRALEPKP